MIIKDYTGTVKIWNVRKGKNMKHLKKYLSPYKMESILAPLFKLLEGVFDLLVPLVVARMIDVGIAQNNRSYLVGCFGILLLMAAVGLACSITAQYFAAKASVGFATSLRQAVFDHIQSLSFAKLDTVGADTLITRLTTDINQVQNGVNMGLRLLLRSPFIVFGAMIMAFTINVRCAVIFAVTIPILFVVVFGIMLVSIPLFQKVQRALDRVTRLTRENLTGVRVIRAFCREEQSVQEFEEGNDALTRMNLFVGRISALLNPVTYVLINVAAVILIDRASLQVNLGTMQQGQIVALYNYMLQIIVELIKLASLIITLNKAAACARRVSDVLEVPEGMSYPAEHEGKENGTRTAEGKPSVEFSDVSFTYEGAGAPSLSHISFACGEGDTIGVIGGTGSGKTTLVSLIPRFYDATEGSVRLDGKEVRSYSREELCRKVGIVQQKSVLFRGTVRENLKMGNEEASEEEIWEALQTAQAKEVIEKKPGKLDFEVEQGGRNLSGGQKQRLSIARVLVQNPEILILDDSSSALDFATDAALRKALRSRKKRTTTFLVSQRIAGIRDADQILVLDNGVLKGVGTHEELLNSCKVYQEIFDSQYPGERTGEKQRKESGVRA